MDIQEKYRITQTSSGQTGSSHAPIWKYHLTLADGSQISATDSTKQGAKNRANAKHVQLINTLRFGEKFINSQEAQVSGPVLEEVDKAVAANLSRSKKEKKEEKNQVKVNAVSKDAFAELPAVTPAFIKQVESNLTGPYVGLDLSAAYNNVNNSGFSYYGVDPGQVVTSQARSSARMTDYDVHMINVNNQLTAKINELSLKVDNMAASQKEVLAQKRSLEAEVAKLREQSKRDVDMISSLHKMLEEKNQKLARAAKGAQVLAKITTDMAKDLGGTVNDVD